MLPFLLLQYFIHTRNDVSFGVLHLIRINLFIVSILLIAPDRDMQPFRMALKSLDPNLDVDIWPDFANKERVNLVVAWNHPENLLGQFPNLKVVYSLGAGVDHLIDDSSIPEDVTITRLVAPSLKTQVADYVEMSCYNIIRKTPEYFRQRQKGIWKILPHHNKEEMSVGILGLGEIGGFAAEKLAANRWRVNGWSGSPKKLAGVTSYSKEELAQFLKATNIVVCLLPLTGQTDGILDLELFKQIKKPGFLINTGRGRHLVEEDLIYALDAGILEAAVLDVFEKEPLPGSHPFWNRPGITITPHVAAITDPNELAQQLIDNYKRLLSGMELAHTVNREEGY